MEGYMDVIMAHQCGVSEAVASMGTAITETQVNILKKLTRNLVLSLDADAAGEEAMLRTVGYENVLNAEMRVILLPEGKDPDEVMRADIGLWEKLVAAAVPLIDFLFEKTAGRLDLSTAAGKSKAVDGLLPILAAIGDPIRQAHYLQKLAALVKVDMNAIKDSLRRLKPSPARRAAPREALKPAASLKPGRSTLSSSREEYLLALLLQYHELKIELEGLSPECFENTENREIYNTWKETRDVVLLKERLDPAILEHLEIIVNKRLPGTGNNIEQRCIDCACELKKTYLKNLSARVAGTGEVRIEIPEQIKELDARKSKKNNPSYKERIRR
jgi:DNA primase